LEVILYNPATGKSVLLSAWGEKADLYRNIQATPALEGRTASERYVPVQRFLVPEENHAVLADYRPRNPPAFRFYVKASGFGYPLQGLEDERRKYAESLRLVAIRPGNETNGRGPSGGQTNTTQREVVR
jgi:hypothetical protein